MSGFDFNPINYTDQELEQLLKLPSSSYNTDDVNTARTKIQQQFQASAQGLAAEQKQEILNFLDEVSRRLQSRAIALAGGYETRALQQGSQFIIENVDRVAGLTAKVGNGRITTGGSVDVPPGYLNPLNVRTIMQAISIDSRFRPNYYGTLSTNFDVTLPSIQKNVVSMRVASIELPITYYAISASYGNNAMLILKVGTSNAWLLTLPDGNYEQSFASNSNAMPLETAMTSAIVNALPGTMNGEVFQPNYGGTHLSATDLTFSIDRTSGRAYFVVKAGGAFDPAGVILRFNVDTQGNLNMATTIQLRLGWQLGFRSAEYQTTTQAVSEGICLVSGPRYGFISINDYQKNTGPTYMVAYANSVLQDNIITRINLAELQADVGVYQCASDPGLSNQLNRTREYFGAVDIQRLHIALYDEFGRVINLNNMDWSMTLCFEILYN